jgi:hypothetical protein
VLWQIIAIKVKAELVNFLSVQVCTTTSEYEDDEVEDFYDVIEISLKRMEKVRQTSSNWMTATVW